MFLQNPQVPTEGTELLGVASRFFINSGCEFGFAPSPLHAGFVCLFHSCLGRLIRCCERGTEVQRGFPEVAELLRKGGKQFPAWCNTQTQPWCCLAHPWPGGHSGHHCRLIKSLCCCFFPWQRAGGSNQEQAGGSERTGGRRKCGNSK